MIWGFVGPCEARFSSFAPNPLAALRHLGGLMRGQALHYPSHNPAGAMMAYGLWACLGVITMSGIAMTGQGPFARAELEAAVAAGDWSVLVQDAGEDAGAEDSAEDSARGEALEEVHEMAANLIVVLAFLHVAGVAVESRVMRRNLVLAMLLGRRR